MMLNRYSKKNLDSMDCFGNVFKSVYPGHSAGPIILSSEGSPKSGSVPVADMPDDFVKLSNIDPDIIQSPRYAGSENFLGKPVPGYYHDDIYCTRQAAIALKDVNASLRRKGYTLVVYDGYRPQRAVNAFIAWSKEKHDNGAKSKYYPSLPKNKLVNLGYLAIKSGHSRGSTIDLSIIPSALELKPIVISHRKLNNGELIPFLDDNTVDMGAGFDLFHPVSHSDSTLITPEQAQMRALLRKEMEAHGFQGIKEEWWHFTLEHEPYPDTYFDFIP